jgi:hypothetical protein
MPHWAGVEGEVCAGAGGSGVVETDISTGRNRNKRAPQRWPQTKSPKQRVQHRASTECNHTADYIDDEDDYGGDENGLEPSVFSWQEHREAERMPKSHRLVAEADAAASHSAVSDLPTPCSLTCRIRVCFAYHLLGVNTETPPARPRLLARPCGSKIAIGGCSLSTCESID